MNAFGIQNATDDFIVDTGEIAGATTTNKDGRVFLETRVTDAGDVGDDGFVVASVDGDDKALSGVGFFRGHVIDFATDTTELWVTIEGGGAGATAGDFAGVRFTDQLLSGGHGEGGI